VRCRDDVSNAKPAPDLYIAALDSLGVSPLEALAIEDSPNGVIAAKQAGMLCVAVPNSITARLDLSHADLVLRSLSDVSLPNVLKRLDGGPPVATS
jgi:beta-phosphoglucomutase-like phosphatase (HAD superfamily)